MDVVHPLIDAGGGLRLGLHRRDVVFAAAAAHATGVAAAIVLLRCCVAGLLEVALVGR